MCQLSVDFPVDALFDGYIFVMSDCRVIGKIDKRPLCSSFYGFLNMDIVVFAYMLWWGVNSFPSLGFIDGLLNFCVFHKDNLYGSFVGVLSEDNNKSENNILSKVFFNIIFGAVGLVILLFIVDIWMVRNHEGVAGVFGDFFGGVLNPILTFLTFLGLIVTIIVQRHDLRLSRIEYERTAEALTTQSVENTFFNTLELHNKISENIKFDLSAFGGSAYREKLSSIKKFMNANLLGLNYDDTVSAAVRTAKNSTQHAETTPVIASITVYEGRAAFQEILKYLSSDSATPNQIVSRYVQIQEEHNHILGHYFRNLYQVLKMIDRYDETIVSWESKKKYASILRAQLSTKELALLFVNCLDNVCDKGQFKNYLIKYKMFEHLNCREVRGVKGRFQLGGGTGILVDRSMLLQYKHAKVFPPLDLVKTFGGAFGKNRGIPYDLANKNYLEDDE